MFFSVNANQNGDELSSITQSKVQKIYVVLRSENSDSNFTPIETLIQNYTDFLNFITL